MKIIFLIGKGNSAKYIYNGIEKDYPVFKVIVEDSVNPKKLIKGRIRRLGYLKVINQLLFQVLIFKFLVILSKKRIAFLKKELNLNETLIPQAIIENVSSVNSNECIAILKREKPDVIIVNGTRIIGKKTLGSTNAIILNTHVGITPKYRGVHGGYWALVKNDKENCGVTIHLVDAGIDTGSIVAQGIIVPDKKDNFSTYLFYQYAAAIPLMKETLAKIKNKSLKTYKEQHIESKLYYHPTFTGYLYNLFINGVK